MAPNTATYFIFLGLGFLLLEVRQKEKWPSQALALIVLGGALVSLLGYTYGAKNLYGVGSYIPMALSTATLFFWAGTGLLCVQENGGFVSLLTGGGSGSTMARRLLPTAVSIPCVLGLLRVWGERFGLYETEFGSALMVVFMVALLVAAIAVTACALNRLDEARGQAVDDLRRKHEELQNQTQVFQSILNNMHDGVVVANVSGEFQLFNSAAEKILGLGPISAGPESWAEQYGCFLADAKTPYPTQQLPLTRALRGEVVDSEELFIRNNQMPEGVWLSITGQPLQDGSGSLRGGVVVFHDISERKRTEELLRDSNQQLEHRIAERTQELRLQEEQLRQAHKMEAVGQLAGGVAHDFNNLLTVILGYSEMLLQAHDQEHNTGGTETVEALGEIHDAAERAAGLTRQLLAFGRKQVLQPKTLNLNDVATGMAKMLHRLIGEDIRIRTVLASKLDAVFADPGQVDQILMNLAVNARDAMPDGGELGIETANIELGPDYCSLHQGVKPGSYVMLAVNDSGSGMDAATQARIFEPFFTTKEVGKGTGLGLATVFGIVKQSGGHIWVYSEVGLGTTFKIYLPAVKSNQPQENASRDDRTRLKGTETVLLVEDEAGIRSMTRLALKSFGYSILEAAHPREAIRISQEHPGKIDILLTDVIMPQINGRRLAELLQPDRPEMKVLFISGYSGDTIARNGILNDDLHFLQKPFTPVVLAKRLRETLDTGASEPILEVMA